MEEKNGVEQAMPDNEQNITNSDFFKNLSDEEKKLALEILKQYATEGQSDLFEDLKYADFEEIPVDISTFMHDPRYLGKALYDQEGRFTIFPYWEKTLEDIFPDNISTKYNNIVFTGAIGLGKSTIAVICLLYLLYRLLCLKNPYTYYGMQEIDKITISLMNITLDNAKGVALDKMNQMILSSEWFMSHGEMAGSTNLVFHPEKHIEVIVASSNNQIIGRALFANFTDECVDGETVIKTADGDKKIKDLVGKEFKVYSIDEFGKEILSNVCTAKPTKVTNEEYKIELEYGSIIKCTGNHLFMLKDGTYKRADELTEDDELFDTQDTYENFTKINSIKKIILSEEKQYYDVINAAPYHNFLIKSNSGYICTHNCNFSLMSNPEKQKKKMLKLITQIDARMKSRFMRGTYLPTLNILASSKDTEQSFLEEYIDITRKAKDTSTLVVDEPQWVVDERKDSPEKFWVGIGNKFLANELLPLDATESEIDEFRKKGYELWQVPMGYLSTFQKNLDEAICSIIGIATASSLKYISGIKINQTKTDTYANPFVKDVIEVGNNPDDHLQYANFFDMTRVSENDISKPLFIHLDMSMSGDKTGIAGVWITGREKNIKALPMNEGNTAAADDNVEADFANDLHYKLAFSVSVKAPKGAQVSFAKNRNFIRWLRDQGFAIKCVSSDTFQSANIQQDLKSDGFKTEIVSVDRVAKDANGKPVCLPYHYLKSSIYERRLVMYQKCDLLTDELIGLERKSDGHVDHTKQGIDSKDQADAVCGALWDASKFSEEYSYSYGDDLDATIEANNAAGELDLKHQLIQDFQNEMLKVKHEQQNYYEMQRKDDYEYFADLRDGIIVI